MQVKVTHSGLDDIDRVLREAERRIIPEGKKVVGQGCNNIKKDAQRRVRGMPHLPHLAGSFNYDVTARGTTITGEAGADRNKLQGGLDPYIEYGTPTSAPHPHWGPALDAEAPRFEKYVGELGEKLLQ